MLELGYGEEDKDWKCGYRLVFPSFTIRVPWFAYIDQRSLCTYLTDFLLQNLHLW